MININYEQPLFISNAFRKPVHNYTPPSRYSLFCETTERRTPIKLSSLFYPFISLKILSQKRPKKS